MEELNRQNAELRAYLTAALAQLADKEGQVCRARVLIENRYTPAALWLEELLAALSSPSPCRHAKEAKRLREAVEWALTDPITTEDVVLKQWIIFWREDLKHRLQRAGAASTSPALCCCCREEAIRIVARYTDTDRPLIDHIIEDLRGEK